MVLRYLRNLRCLILGRYCSYLNFVEINKLAVNLQIKEPSNANTSDIENWLMLRLTDCGSTASVIRINKSVHKISIQVTRNLPYIWNQLSIF